SGDNLKHVIENRARVAEHLGVGVAALCTAYQIHSPKTVIVEKPWEAKDAPQCDALVTKIPGIAIGVLTADCLPILMADPKGRVIAAVHSGWKGAFDGVIDAAVNAMASLGAQTADITASLGPCIGHASYEVGPEFHARFIQQDMTNDHFFTP